jgi:hypothetical protein
LEGWDPQKLLSKLLEQRERRSYLRRWTEQVNPDDPDLWEEMRGSYPEEWRRNTWSIPEYAEWVEEERKGNLGWAGMESNLVALSQRGTSSEER